MGALLRFSKLRIFPLLFGPFFLRVILCGFLSISSSNLFFLVCLWKFSKQLLDPEQVDVVHPLDKERGLTLEDFKLIKLHISNCNLYYKSFSDGFCYIWNTLAFLRWSRKVNVLNELLDDFFFLAWRSFSWISCQSEFLEARENFILLLYFKVKFAFFFLMSYDYETLIHLFFFELCWFDLVPSCCVLL